MMTVVRVWQYLSRAEHASAGRARGGHGFRAYHIDMPSSARLKAASCSAVRCCGLFWKSEAKSKKEEKVKELKPKQAGKNQVNPPEYLLFLKKGKDGMYEPVSGQLDAALSVRTIFPSGVIKVP